MRFSVNSLFALLSILPPALAAEVPDLSAVVGIATRELAGPYNAVAKVDLTYRICPRARYDCRAMGQFVIGTYITLDCYTMDNTTPVNGDYSWGKLAGNGYWVAIAGGENVSLSGALPPC